MATYVEGIPGHIVVVCDLCKERFTLNLPKPSKTIAATVEIGWACGCFGGRWGNWCPACVGWHDQID